MFTQDITLTLVGLIIVALICIVIFSLGFVIGKYVQASMARDELESIFESGLIIALCMEGAVLPGELAPD